MLWKKSPNSQEIIPFNSRHRSLSPNLVWSYLWIDGNSLTQLQSLSVRQSVSLVHCPTSNNHKRLLRLLLLGNAPFLLPSLPPSLPPSPNHRRSSFSTFRLVAFLTIELRAVIMIENRRGQKVPNFSVN